ncbi:hypothetical protein CBS12448_11087 [Aspergillus niger]|nr:hypothetical protein CBS12448_11087 [Aspergillus niger]KAI2984156.1 hypothetical protein CBS147345_11140 [Aspergillus niger]KAI3030884.1 hypothetical protein CBS147347_2557 [Aspergillus niger]
MEYIRHSTSITVPEVFGTGNCWAGPYIVMSFLEGVPLSQILKDPSIEGRPVLNPQISDRSLKWAYYEMAKVILELSKHEFDSIGALAEDERGISIARRPLTFNMNELMASANLPEEVFPLQPFRSATDYFKALAMQHLFHLRLQQRDAVNTTGHLVGIQVQGYAECQLGSSILNPSLPRPNSTPLSFLFGSRIKNNWEGPLSEQNLLIRIISTMSDQKARESFASILSYYRHNRESLERVPNWVDDPDSQSIVIGFLRDTPTDEQVEQAKEELKALMAIEEIKETLSETEKDLLTAASLSSRAKRLQNKKDK